MIDNTGINALFALPVALLFRSGAVIEGTVEARRRRRMRPTLMALEDRKLLSMFTVNSTLDDGSVGTLRWAIGQANSTGGAETITFDPTVFASAQTITLTGGQLELSDTSGTETITGPAAGVTVSGDETSRVFQVDPGVTADLSGLTISGGSTGNGGGLYNGGTTTLTNSTLSGNTANGNGGGIYNFGTLTLTNSTLSGNGASGFGGAIFTYGGNLSLSDCTLALNTAGVSGGALDASGPVTVTSSTFSANQATSGGGGAIDNFNSQYIVTIGDSILAGNSCAYGPDFSNRVNSLGHNLVGETDGSSGWVGSDLTGTTLNPLNPLLAPFGNYGGPTQTMALLPGSPAIDAGTAGAGIPATDQRGALRGPPGLNAGTAVDIGAYEASSSYLVTSTADSYDVGTLRAGVGWANVSTNANPANIASPAPNTIVFDTAGAFATPQTITLTQNDSNLAFGPTALVITSDVTIVGPAGGLTISSNNTHRVFAVASGATLTLQALTVTGGLATAGGGIYNNGGTLTIDTCTISGNSVDNGYGGGIYNAGALTIDTSTISNNTAGGAGGGVYNSATLTITDDSHIDENRALRGGGLFNDSSTAVIQVTASTINGNSANDSGGGIENLGTVTLTSSSTLTGNSAGSFGGGAIYNGGTATVTGGTLSGNHAANGGSGGAINNVSGATLTVADSTLSGNSATLNGGGIDNFGTAMLTNCTLSDNSADFNGGGVYNASNRTLTVSGSTFTDNSARGDGGGIYNASTGTATISGSTVSGNTASGDGGGVYNAGLWTSYSSPISGNTARGDGGGVYNTGRWTSYNSPISGNTAGGNGGGVYNAGLWTSYNSPISGNTAGGFGDDLYVVRSEPSLPPPSNTQPAIQLVGAQSSSLALIATLVVTSLNGGESQIMSVGSGTASVLPTQATAPSGNGGEGAHAADESGNPLGGLSILIPSALRPWVLVLLGTNEALARIRGTIPDLFTSGDGQQGPVELLSRAYQAVVRTIDEAIPFLASQGDPISLAALPVPAVAWGIDEVASDLALEEPFQPQATPSAASAAADDVRHLGEVLARPTKLWRVGLVGGFITGSTVIAANAVRKAFQRHRR